MTWLLLITLTSGNVAITGYTTEANCRAIRDTLRFWSATCIPVEPDARIILGALK